MRRTYDFLDLVYEVSERHPFQSILCVPVRVSSECKGVLNLDCMKQNAFGEFDFDLADVAAALIGMAIDRVGLGVLQ
jgi:GAF domain-containing protein